MLHKPTNGLFIIFALMLTIFAGGVAYAQKADTGSGKISVGSSDGAPGKGIGFGSAGAPSPYSRPTIGDFGRSRPPSMVELPDDRMSRKQAVAPTSTARSKQFKSSISTVIPFSAPPNLGPDPFNQARVVGPDSLRRVPLVSNEPTKDPQPASPATPLPIRRGVAPQATKLTQPTVLGWAPDSPRRVPLVSNEPTKDPEPAGLRNDSPRRVPLVSNEPTKDPEPARAFRMSVVVTDPYERTAAPKPSF